MITKSGRSEAMRTGDDISRLHNGGARLRPFASAPQAAVPGVDSGAAANITRLAVAHEMPQVDGVRHRFQAAGGLNFHVAEAGEGEPVLLLHGWPQHWYCWRLVIPEL